MPSASTTITGNVVQDPELKYTGNGAAILSFTVACNYSWKTQDGEWDKKVSYFDVTVWKQLAEDAANVLAKGAGVVVTGRLEQQTWEDKESGQKRSKVQIVADDIAVQVRSIDTFTRRKSEFGEGKQAAKPKAAPARKSPQDEEPF